MWILTVDGFYSAVQDKGDPARIMVRARQKRELETLLKRLDGEDLEILAWTGSDYAYRVFLYAATDVVTVPGGNGAGAQLH